MSRYRFLLSWQWIGAFLLCVVAALVCVRLGQWQHHRWTEKEAINASIDNARHAAPLPAANALSTHEQPTHRREYTKVTAAGRYDVAKQVMVRNQTVDSDVGFDVLTPLETSDGRTLWVVRGWIKALPGSATDIPRIPDPPSGVVTVVGRIKRVDTGATDAITVDSQALISRITMHQVHSTGKPAYEAYVQMISEQPAAADTTTLTLLPAPDDLDEGLHIAYWVQWNLFAGGFIVGFFWYARNYARREDEPEPASAVGAASTPLPSGVEPGRPKRQKRRREPLPAPIPTRNGKPIAIRVPEDH